MRDLNPRHPCGCTCLGNGRLKPLGQCSGPQIGTLFKKFKRIQTRPRLATAPAERTFQLLPREFRAILIDRYDSPFVRRVAIALRLYRLPFEHRPWSTFGEGDKIAPYNLLRRVPTPVPSSPRPACRERSARSVG